ncbi:TonB-dependent siderophore receptor [Janthinobacterium sp. HLS12-2]|uniref:TonB-dependent siderophore receptor n=1 Tax=Janthinobacterium sp. HLS12-2 TaxID=1259324 RepID=UPI003F25A747
MWSPRLNLTPAPLALAAMLALGSISLAKAQTAPTVKLAIAAQPLGQALNELARQANLQLLFAPELVAGKTAPAVSGTLSVADSLERLLAGSGLAAAIDGNSVIIRPTPAATGKVATLAEITVSARQEATTDTELTKSYAAQAVSIGKGRQSLREIPQSVSVLTRQQLNDQNMLSLDDAMRGVTGITVEASSTGGNHGNFYSRGYALDAVQVDGVMTPASTGNDLSAGFGLAIYDRVEVLRGPAGLFQGAGDPGGTINLVRKRARDTFAASGVLSAGSWDRYYAEADVTGPLSADGRLRGRLVAAYEHRRSFVDHVYAEKPLLYGTVAVDVAPGTVLTGGVTYQEYKGRPAFGLPAYEDGRLLDVPRSTYLDPAWNHITEKVTEYFAEFEHKLDNGGQFKATALYREQDEPSRNFGWSDCSADPVTGDSCLVSWNYRSHWKTQGLDAWLATPFQAFGRSHDLIVGADYRQVHKNFQYGGGDNAPINIVHPDNNIAQPSYTFSNGNDNRTKQFGLYARTRLQATDRLAVNLGGRLTHWDNHTVNRNAYFNQFTDVSNTINAKFTPYAGLVYELDKQVSAYGSYTRIFTPQSTTDAAGQTLKPRTGQQFELGLKAELFDKNVNAHAALFRMEDENRVMPDPANPLFSIGAGKMRSQGMEAELSGSPLPGWNITSGYSYTSTRTLEGSDDQKAQLYTFIAPRHNVNVWTNYRLAGALDKISVGGGLRSVSSMYRLNGPVKFEQGPVTTVGLQAGYRLSPKLELSLTVNNLFDKKYYTRVWAAYGSNFYGEPRNAMLTLRGQL